MSELAEAALLSRAGITRLVERLEREGLVERREGEHDSRQVFAYITERGLKRLADSAPSHFAGVRERFLAPLTRTQKRERAGAWQRLLSPDTTAEPPTKRTVGRAPNSNH
jgi:DNA-binding MarR family transcriptional regulator